MRQIRIIAVLFATVAAFWLLADEPAVASKENMPREGLKLYSVTEGYFEDKELVHSKEEWKKLLTAEQYHILREQGTERAFTGKYWNNHAHGVYRCAGCGLDLYHSDNKYESGTGWPSYDRAVAEENVSIRSDVSFFMTRNELVCSRCNGHLGHVFDDGPAPTGKRHCINSAALVFHELKQ